MFVVNKNDGNFFLTFAHAWGIRLLFPFRKFRTMSRNFGRGRFF